MKIIFQFFVLCILVCLIVSCCLSISDVFVPMLLFLFFLVIFIFWVCFLDDNFTISQSFSEANDALVTIFNDKLNETLSYHLTEFYTSCDTAGCSTDTFINIPNKNCQVPLSLSLYSLCKFVLLHY